MLTEVGENGFSGVFIYRSREMLFLNELITWIIYYEYDGTLYFFF